MVLLYGDGSCALHCGTVDMGQASDTAMAQIVSEVLGIPTESVRVVHPDTDVDAVRHGARSDRARRSTWATPCARPREDVRAQVLRIAATALDADPSDLECVDAEVVLRRGARMTMREIMLARFAMQAGTIVGVGSYAPPYKKPDPDTGQSPDVTPFWMLGGAGAEIAVDIETGRIEVTKLVNVADVGRAINPASSIASSRGGDHAGRVHAVRGDGLQRRPGGERQPR